VTDRDEQAGRVTGQSAPPPTECERCEWASQVMLKISNVKQSARHNMAGEGVNKI
jgi:hypothetical protein